MKEGEKTSVGADSLKKKEKLRKTKLNKKRQRRQGCHNEEEVSNKKAAKKVQNEEEKEPQKKKQAQQESQIGSDSESGCESDYPVHFYCIMSFICLFCNSKFVYSPVIDTGETQNF